MDTVDLALRIRKHVLNMTNRGNSSHVGSAFSIADIVAVLYGAVLTLDVTQPKLAKRDRFILSKGHAGVAVYAALAERGFFPAEELLKYYTNGSVFSGHLSHKGVPGVELSTGSLGHGLPVAAGMALSAKLDDAAHRVYVLLGDGECDEGSNWEAIMFAAHYKLGNLTAIVDYNKLQSLAAIKDTIGLEPFADKWRAFGWTVLEADGHDHAALQSSLENAPGAGHAPRVVICHTTKGKGVSFMENSVLWHYRSPQADEFAAALLELEASQHA